MGVIIKWFGIALWIMGVGGSLFILFQFIRYGEGTTLSDKIVSAIVVGYLFIALGEIIILLEKNLKQNQDLYKLFENWGGENQ
jgi:uncharacterized protein involved in response to NO